MTTIFRVIVAVVITAGTAYARIDVTTRGLVGDGQTDNSPALQALVNSIPSTIKNATWGPPVGGELFYFPPGKYVLNSQVDFSRLTLWGLAGDLDASGNPTATLICPTPNTIMLYELAHSHKHDISRLNLVASNAGGTVLQYDNSMTCRIEDCVISGYNGIVCPGPGGEYSGSIRRTRFIGTSGQSNIGITHCAVTCTFCSDCLFDGWSEGARTGGSGFSIVRCTFNSCAIGLRCGVAPNGTNGFLGRSVLRDLTFTNCPVSFAPQSLGSTLVSNVSIVGAPSIGKTGVDGNNFNCVVTGLSVNGSFSSTSLKTLGGYSSTFYAPVVGNDVPSASVWTLPKGGLPGVANYTTYVASQPILSGSVISSTLPLPPNSDDLRLATLAPLNSVDVTTHGILGDNKTDNTAALQALINASPAGTEFYFPSGVYLTSATLDLSKLSNWSFRGDMASSGGSQIGSTISCTKPVDLLHADYQTAGTFKISDLNLQVRKANTLYARNAVMASVERCEVMGVVGIYLENPILCAVRSVQYGGTTIALQINGGYDNTIENHDMAGGGEGIRAGGTSRLAVIGSRFEVCKTALNLGVDPSGNTSAIYDCSFQGIGMEANNYAIQAVSCRNCFFGGIGAQGSTNAPAGLSISGTVEQDVQGCVYAAVSMYGAYSRYCAEGNGSTFIGCRDTNGSATGLGVWSGTATKVNCP